MSTPKSTEKPPVTFQFSALDAETRDAFRRWCEVEIARAGAAEAVERTKQQDQYAENQRLRGEQDAADEAAELRRIVERTKAEAEAGKIAAAARLEQAKIELEIRKLGIEGRRLEDEAMLGIAAKAVDLIWPRLAAIGAGISAEARQDRELIREEMRLIAGRNPVDGTWQ